MTALRSRIFTGAPSAETQIITGTTDSWVGAIPVAVLNCHGAGETALTTMDTAQTRRIIDGIAQTATVFTGDFGLQTWGNDTFVSRAESARVHLEAQWGVTRRLILVGASMGFLNACNYARTFPARVAAIAGVIPGVDLTDLWANRGAAADIDAAYGGTYDPGTEGPIHNPVEFAASGLSPTLPIHIWNAPDDTICVPSTVNAFLAARPQTEQTVLPPGGHSMASVGNAAAGVISWVADRVASL